LEDAPLTGSSVFSVMPLEYHKMTYFRDVTKRLDTLPFVSGDTFKLFSDYWLDTDHYQKAIDDTIPSDFNLKQNAKIFVHTEMLDTFFSKYFSYITTIVILISHNHDAPVTEKYLKFLNDQKVIVWFAENPYFEHPKLVPIPIGFMNAHHSPIYNDHVLALKHAYLKPWTQRKITIYINFNQETNENARKGFFEYFKKFKGAMILDERTTFSTYIKHLNNSKFVLCPRGNGLDTHRFAETVRMGAIPIVQSSPLNSLYQNSTVLVLKDLKDLTEDMLVNPERYIKNMEFPKDIIYMETWLKKLYSYS